MLLCLDQIFLALPHINCPRGFNRHFFFQWKSYSFLWVKYKRQTDNLNSTNAQHAEHYFERANQTRFICAKTQRAYGEYLFNSNININLYTIVLNYYSTACCVNLAKIILTSAISTHLLYKGSFSHSRLPPLIANSKEHMIRICSSAQFEGSSRWRSGPRGQGRSHSFQ